MIVIYITDSRPQYPPSVLQTVGLPTGSHTEYRYATKWLSNGLLERWGRNALVNEKVLVCFLEGNKGDLSIARAVPVRVALVAKTELHGTFATMQVELEGFPTNLHLHELTHLCGLDNIIAPGPRQKVFILEAGLPPMPVTGNEEVSLWQDVVYALSDMITFSEASFVLFEGVIPEGAMPAAVNRGIIRPISGKVRLRPEASYEILIHLYAKNSTGRRHVYAIYTDETLIRLVDAGSMRLRSKFTSFRLLSHTCRTLKTEVTALKVSVEDGSVGPDISVRIEISSTWIAQMRTLSLPSVSAAMAASAGVAGPGVPLWLRVAMVAAGSIGLAIGARR